MSDESFDGFIAEDGEKIPVDDAARLIPMAEEYLKDEKKLRAVLMSLGRHCIETSRFAGAQAYFEKLYQLTDSSNDKAFCLLSIGQMMEKQEEYESALGWYRKAFSLEQGGGEVWYLLNNNLGYCLNLFERHGEAMEHCLAAISIEPNRYNAHKNLGVALEGLCRYADSVKAYITATLLNPRDLRALHHLESLVASHPEVQQEVSELNAQIDACRKAAEIIWQ